MAFILWSRFALARKNTLELWQDTVYSTISTMHFKCMHHKPAYKNFAVNWKLHYGLVFTRKNERFMTRFVKLKARRDKTRHANLQILSSTFGSNQDLYFLNIQSVPHCENFIDKFNSLCKYVPLSNLNKLKSLSSNLCVLNCLVWYTCSFGGDGWWLR